MLLEWILWDLPPPPESSILRVYLYQFLGFTLPFLGLSFKTGNSSRKKNIKTWTYWCILMGQVIVLLMEKTWASCRRKHSEQVRGMRRGGEQYENITFLMVKPLVKRRFLPSLSLHGQAEVSSWTWAFQKKIWPCFASIDNGRQSWLC